jgi:hypothetical protein
MRDEHISTEHYAAVIADLRAKRDELDRTIANLEAMQAMPKRKLADCVAPHVSAFKIREPRPQPEPSRIAPNKGGTGIGDAVMRVLREAQVEL